MSDPIVDVVPATEYVVVTVNVAEPGPPGNNADATALIAAHVADTTPHPVYDDVASFVLDIENALI